MRGGRGRTPAPLFLLQQQGEKAGGRPRFGTLPSSGRARPRLVLCSCPTQGDSAAEEPAGHRPGGTKPRPPRLPPGQGKGAAAGRGGALPGSAPRHPQRGPKRGAGRRLPSAGKQRRFLLQRKPEASSVSERDGPGLPAGSSPRERAGAAPTPPPPAPRSATRLLECCSTQKSSHGRPFTSATGHKHQ